MSGTPQAFMIFKEELRKAEVEKKRLELHYDSKISNLSQQISVLKEKMVAQEQMMKSALDYAIKLEEELNDVKQNINNDLIKNSSGYH
jgi:type I site-specific restriction endonuclease